MAGTVKLPGLGEVKTGYVWAGAAVIAVIVGFAYYRHRNSAAAASSTTDTTGTAATDPQTGYPSGSPEDLAALQQLQSGLGDAYSGVGGGYAGYGTGYSGQQYYYDPQDGLYDLTSPYTGGSSDTSNTGPGTFTDNAYWTTYCIGNVQGYSGSQIQGAIAAVLAGQALTTQQMTIWQSCIAVAGEPPVPPTTAPHLANNGGGTTGGSGGGGGGGGSVTLHAPGGVRVKSRTSTGFTVTWNGVSNAAGYEVEITHQGAEIAHGTREGNTDHQLSVGGLKANTSYGIRVAAFGSSGQGPSSAVIYDYTAK